MTYLTNDFVLLQQLSSLNIVSIDRPVISFDSLKKQVIYAFVGRNSVQDEFIIEIRIKRFDLYRLEEINVYSPQPNLPPALVLTNLGSVALAGSTFSGSIVTTNTLPSPPLLPLPAAPTSLTTGQTVFNISSPPVFLPLNLPNTVFLL